MAIDKKHLGRKYGPYQFTVGAEEIGEFARAISGGTPGRVFGANAGDAHPWFVDERAARQSPYGSIVAPPTFAARFAIEPFAVACSDPELGLNLVRLVHGEQEFELHDVLRPGDVLETTGEITSIKSKGPLDFVEVTTTSRRVADGKTVVEGVWTAIIRS